MATTTKQTWAERLAATLNKAATDIGDFQVQLALGKAEARDEYEKLKKNLRQKFSESGPIYTTAKKQIRGAEETFDDLRVQLALGKAETADIFNQQKKKITGALNKIDTALSSLPHDDHFRLEVRSELEKTRIKLDILRLHYRFADMTADETKKKIADLKARVADIRNNAGLTEQLGNVEREIEAAYTQLKKAFA